MSSKNKYSFEMCLHKIEFLSLVIKTFGEYDDKTTFKLTIELLIILESYKNEFKTKDFPSIKQLNGFIDINQNKPNKIKYDTLIKHRDIVEYLFSNNSSYNIKNELDFIFYRIENTTSLTISLFRDTNIYKKINALKLDLPDFINQIMVSILNPKDNEVVYDPAAGNGIILKEVNNFNPYVKIIGQEINKGAAEFGTLILDLNFSRNTSSYPAFFISNSNAVQDPIIKKNSADVIVCKPPFGGNFNDIKFFDFDKLSKDFSKEVVFFEMMLSRLNKKSGRMAVVMPDSFLNRLSTKNIRKHLINNDLIEGIISLPGGSIPKTFIKTSILIINYNKTNHRQNKILFIGLEDAIKFNKRQGKLIFDKTELNILATEVIALYKNKHKSSITHKNVATNTVVKQDFDLTTLRYTSEIFQLIEETSKTERLIKLGDIIKKIKTKNIQDSNIKMRTINIKDLNTDSLSYKLNLDNIEPSFIKTNHKKITNSCLLVAQIGQKLKPTCFNHLGEDIVINNNIIPFFVDETKINIEYLIDQLNSEFVTSQIEVLRNSGPIPFITLETIRNIKIKLPAIEKQKEQVLYRMALSLTEENLKILDKKEELKIDIADQNSFLRHQIAGSFRSVRKSFEALNDIIENQVALKYKGLYNLKVSKKSNLTFGKYLEIINRDLKSIQQSIKRTGIAIEFTNFKPVKFDIIRFVKDYCKELNEIKEYQFNYSNMTVDLRSSKIKNVYISGDKELIRKMFDNIVENAEKHGFNEKKYFKNLLDVFLFFDFNEMKVQIDFSNTGIPMHKELTYENFKRKGGRAGLKSGDGTGGWLIGEIMKLHNGKFSLIDETDENGVGDYVTTLELEFPIITE